MIQNNRRKQHDGRRWRRRRQGDYGATFFDLEAAENANEEMFALIAEVRAKEKAVEEPTVELIVKNLESSGKGSDCRGAVARYVKVE